jgi:hypothetical protein
LTAGGDSPSCYKKCAEASQKYSGDTWKINKPLYLLNEGRASIIERQPCLWRGVYQSLEQGIMDLRCPDPMTKARNKDGQNMLEVSKLR